MKQNLLSILLYRIIDKVKVMETRLSKLKLTFINKILFIKKISTLTKNLTQSLQCQNPKPGALSLTTLQGSRVVGHIFMEE